LDTHEADALRRTGALPLRLGDPGRVGPYTPLALLGSGGMGRVYLARPTDGGPGLVALKVIRPEYAEDARFRRRFEREASVHAQVRSPHTPRLRGVGFEDELLWMATEYLPGLDLADAVGQGGALPSAAVWRLVAELGRALADLAAKGIVHRDLKPSNVLLSARGAHLIDFGISKATDASAITGTGNRVGTPAYMSPEHLRTGHSDTASDVFSLAGALVYAATGRAPFGDGTGVDVMHRVAFEEPYPEVIGAIAAADAELASLLSACLAKEPERRPTPRDLIEAGGGHAAGEGWPEPLGGVLLARQRAYEVLCSLPAEPATHAGPSQDRPQEAPAAPAGPAAPGEVTPAGRPDALAEAAAKAGAAGTDTGTVPGRLRPGGEHARTRRKAVLAVAGVMALCAVAAGVLVLTRQDASATASPPGGGTATAAGTLSGTAAVSRGPAATHGTLVPDGSGSGDGAKGSAGAGDGVPVGAGGSASPKASSSAEAGQAGPHSDPSEPVTAPSDSPAGSTPPTGSSSSEPAAPPWISECTYYAGSGRTVRGDTGKRVRQVQCMLTQRGYSVGPAGVNGRFNAATESAVASFQADKGLNASGIVNRATWSALRDTT
jgi:hypothetical protein